MLEQVRKFVEKQRTGSSLGIRFCLCEKEPAAVRRLRAFASQHPEIEIHVFDGEFEDNLASIARHIPDGFTFTFIDPTNWVVRIIDICRFLEPRPGEFLFNFMTEEVSRHSVNPKVAHQFGDFVGDPNWQETVKQLPDGLRGELKVLHLLKAAFRSRGVARYLPDFSILKNHVEREKMRLMLGTDEPKGVKLFRDIHARVEKEEFETRRRTKSAKTSQDMLFSNADFALHEQGERGVGCKRYQRVSEEIITEALSGPKEIEFDELALLVMEQLPMKETHVKDVCKSMKDRGLIEYQLEPKARKPSERTVIQSARPSR